MQQCLPRRSLFFETRLEQNAADNLLTADRCNL